MGKPFLQMLREKWTTPKHQSSKNAAVQYKRAADGLSGGRAHGSNYSAYHDQSKRRGRVVPNGSPAK